jgi:hypothetical protein
MQVQRFGMQEQKFGMQVQKFLKNLFRLPWK